MSAPVHFEGNMTSGPATHLLLLQILQQLKVMDSQRCTALLDELQKEKNKLQQERTLRGDLEKEILKQREKFKEEIEKMQDNCNSVDNVMNKYEKIKSQLDNEKTMRQTLEEELMNEKRHSSDIERNSTKQMKEHLTVVHQYQNEIHKFQTELLSKDKQITELEYKMQLIDGKNDKTELQNAMDNLHSKLSSLLNSTIDIKVHLQHESLMMSEVKNYFNSSVTQTELQKYLFNNTKTVSDIVSQLINKLQMRDIKCKEHENSCSIKEDTVKQLQLDLEEQKLLVNKLEKELQAEKEKNSKRNDEQKLQEQFITVLQDCDNKKKTEFRDAIEKCDSESVEFLIHAASVIPIDQRDSDKGDTLLHTAARAGCYSATELLTEKGLVDVKNYDGDTPLYIASGGGKLDIVRILVARNANVNSRNNAMWTPLHIASAKGHFEVVKLLCEKNCDINARHNTNGGTPLIEAAYFGHFEIVQFLVHRGANINMPNYFDHTARELALAKGYKNIADWLANRHYFG